MSRDKHILAAVLAGGEARRFGSDKASAMLDGKRLIDHVADTLAPQAAALVICGREEAGFDCLADFPAAGLGPLGGLNAALRHASSQGFGAVLSAGCDSPFLPADLAKLLAGEGAAIIASQPVIGLWPVQLAPRLESFVSGGGRALYRFAQSVGARRIALDCELLNINRPSDLPR